MLYHRIRLIRLGGIYFLPKKDLIKPKFGVYKVKVLLEEKEYDGILNLAEGIAFNTQKEWSDFIKLLNEFIRGNHRYIRGIEDKQIGKFFIKEFPNEDCIKDGYFKHGYQLGIRK